MIKAQVREHFGRQAYEYERIMVRIIPQYLEHHRIISDLMPEQDRSYRVLDLGCGNGVLSELVLTKYSSPHIVGFDITEGMLMRCSIEKWKIDLISDQAREIFRSIDDEGVKVFRKQPGFIQYRLMLADPHTTVAVAEWESEELGKKGAENYRNWLRSSGIWNKLVLQTYDGEVVAPS